MLTVVHHPSDWETLPSVEWQGGNTPTVGAILYAIGYEQPRYPVPATELTSALAATPERVSPLVKAMLLR